MKQRLVVLDNGTKEVHFHTIIGDVTIDDEYVEKLGYSPLLCTWMAGKDIEIVYHLDKKEHENRRN